MKNKNRNKKKRSVVPYVAAAVVLVLVLVCLLLLRAFDIFAAQAEEEDPADSPSPPAVTQGASGTRFNVKLPYELEDGKLKVVSLFQTDALNPDCGDAEGKNLASLELINTSDKYLSEARISISLADGTILDFAVQDLPAGAVVWAFETGNQSISDDAQCEAIDCTAQFLDEQPLMSGISTEANGASLTVTNQTGADIAVLTLRVHCLFENVYYGGKSVEYTIENIANGTAAEIFAAECYMGTAQAVSIR